jgi:glycosyltransferase involved in cell wall biosynthesis
MNSMRVVVDARTVYNGVRRGTGKNLVDLYRTMARLRPGWTFYMMHRGISHGDDPFAGCNNVRAEVIDMRGDRWNLWEQVRLPVAAVARRASALHSPANTAPAVPLVPLVMTVHDLIPMESNDTAAARAWRANVSAAAQRARRIITPSSYTRTLLTERLGVAPERIVVNHWAPDNGCRRVDDSGEISRVRSRYGLDKDERYVFGFGAADPRKNTPRLIAAWAGLPRSLRAQLGLVLVGLQGSALADATKQAAALAPEGGWHFSGFVPEADLPALLTGATMLCYPSLSEGFGLPVLDAFACDTPVVTSDTTSLPEVAGDAAVLVDPADVAAIRDGIARVASDPAVQDLLRSRGRERLTKFSWERCAETAAVALEEASMRTVAA